MNHELQKADSETNPANLELTNCRRTNTAQKWDIALGRPTTNGNSEASTRGKLAAITAPKKRRKMSAAGRAKIVAAQKALWAKINAKKK